MSQKQKIEDRVFEPLLAGDLNERFFKAVHDKPPLFYDVLKTGLAFLQGNFGSTPVPYEIVLLHGTNVDNRCLEQMMALQDQVAVYAAPHPDNVIDYKTSDDVIDHFAQDGLGLAVLTADGMLIGQVLLSFKQPLDQAPNQHEQLNVGWVMVDPLYAGNKLFETMVGLAGQMAQGSEMAQVKACVRMHNTKALRRFEQAGFSAMGIGENVKDGSPNIQMIKPVSQTDVNIRHQQGSAKRQTMGI